MNVCCFGCVLVYCDIVKVSGWFECWIFGRGCFIFCLNVRWGMWLMWYCVKL